jgi:hypothetical protein
VPPGLKNILHQSKASVNTALSQRQFWYKFGWKVGTKSKFEKYASYSNEAEGD